MTVLDVSILAIFSPNSELGLILRFYRQNLYIHQREDIHGHMSFMCAYKSTHAALLLLHLVQFLFFLCSRQDGIKLLSYRHLEHAVNHDRLRVSGVADMNK